VSGPRCRHLSSTTRGSCTRTTFQRRDRDHQMRQGTRPLPEDRPQTAGPGGACWRFQGVLRSSAAVDAGPQGRTRSGATISRSRSRSRSRPRDLATLNAGLRAQQLADARPAPFSSAAPVGDVRPNGSRHPPFWPVCTFRPGVAIDSESGRCSQGELGRTVPVAGVSPPSIAAADEVRGRERAFREVSHHRGGRDADIADQTRSPVRRATDEDDRPIEAADSGRRVRPWDADRTGGSLAHRHDCRPTGGTGAHHGRTIGPGSASILAT